jgi:hypothetical protein
MDINWTTILQTTIICATILLLAWNGRGCSK